MNPTDALEPTDSRFAMSRTGDVYPITPDIKEARGRWRPISDYEAMLHFRKAGADLDALGLRATYEASLAVAEARAAEAKASKGSKPAKPAKSALVAEPSEDAGGLDVTDILEE